VINSDGEALEHPAAHAEEINQEESNSNAECGPVIDALKRNRIHTKKERGTGLCTKALKR